MASKPTIKNKIVREYLVKFPNSSKASLSRKILKENPLVFDNVEAIRALIRIITGAMGEKRNSRTVDKSLFKEHKTSNPYGLPASY